MDRDLEAFMKERLGVSISDVQKMGPKSLNQLYDRAMALEENLAVRYEDVEDETPEELRMPADLVDYIYKL